MKDRHPATEILGGLATGTAWGAAGIFGLGAVLFVGLMLAGQPDPYGGAAILAVALCALGVATLGLAAIAWLGTLLFRDPVSKTRAAAAVAAFGGATAAFAILIADQMGTVDFGDDTWPFVLAGVSLLALAAVLASYASERPAARAFGVVWVLFVAIVGYRVWTDVRVEVEWLGRGVGESGGAQVAFSASRSGDFEIRVGAQSCFDGRAIASGRYDWRPAPPSLGASAWVALPSAVLPLKRGDVVRVCLHDGFAAGTAAAEADPPSFWPKP